MEKYKNTKITNLKYQLWHGMKSFTYLIDHILHQIFKAIWVSRQKNETVTDNPSIMIYVDKIEDRITLKIKTGYYLEFLKKQWK